uniref:Uncharacterized protein n=1 Tax=Arundo donax TaxID=35708 RepID=A0A0A9HQE1_ARUDO
MFVQFMFSFVVLVKLACSIFLFFLLLSHHLYF